MNHGITPLQLTLPLWEAKAKISDTVPLCDTPAIRHVQHAPIRGYKLLDSEGCAHGYTFEPFGAIVTADLTALHEMCRRPSNRIRSFQLFRQWCWSLEAPHALCHSPLPETVPTLFEPPWSGPEILPGDAGRERLRVVVIETSFEQVLAVGSTWLLSAQFRIVLELSWSDYLSRCTGPFLRLDGTLEFWTRGHLHREPIRQPSDRQHRECQRELDRYRRLSMLGRKSSQLKSEAMILRSESLDETRVPSHQLALRHFELTYHPFAMADLRHLLLADDEIATDECPEKISTVDQWIEMPAVYNADGTVRYYRSGRRHRTQGPAIVTPDGRGVWFNDDRLQDVTDLKRQKDSGDGEQVKSKPNVPSLPLQDVIRERGPKVRINVIPIEQINSPPRGHSDREGQRTHRRFLFSPRFWNLLTPKSRKQLRTTWSESSLDRLEKKDTP